MYVQDLAEQEGGHIHDLLAHKGAHFYVCGDCKMAEGVQQKLKGIVKKHGNMTDEQVQNFMFMLKVSLVPLLSQKKYIIPKSFLSSYSSP